ncbi:hypothetical protein, partial [Stenotrophomonas maltophilia]|uniref:hypothetical protein n=1 Tax=Stenotrophomonas maltophilia TaxID=40324 RepID=UPI0013DBAD8A
MVKFLIKAGFLLIILVAASAGDPDKGGSLFSRAFFGTPADYRQTHQTLDASDTALNGLAGARAGQMPAN